MNAHPLATYGDLIVAAQRDAAWASARLATERIADRATAEAAFTAYRRLLAATGEHLWFLAGGPHRLQGRAATLTPEHVDRPALRLARELVAVKPQPGRDELASPQRGHPGREWLAAAQALGAAKDLVVTHRDVRGWDRTASAGVLDAVAERAFGYGRVADLVLIVTSADRDLALRAAQAGMPWKEAMRRLPQLESIESAARELRREVDLRPVGEPPSLPMLALARPGVRVGEPAVELADRVARVRRGAWTQMRHARRGSAADLVEYAAAAVILHAHVGAHAHQFGGDAATVAAIGERRAGWARQHHALARFTTGIPVTPGLRGDVLALPTLAAVALPLARDAAGVHAAGSPGWDAAAVATALEACAEIATANAATLEVLANRGMLFIDARHLPGDRVSDHPELVTAKVDGRYVPAASEDVTPVVEAYLPLADPVTAVSPMPSEPEIGPRAVWSALGR